MNKKPRILTEEELEERRLRRIEKKLLKKKKLVRTDLDTRIERLARLERKAKGLSRSIDDDFAELTDLED